MRDATETRERIDRAAIRLFVQKGVDATSIRQIAKEAGVSLGALYNHYPGKDDMVESVFSRNWAVVGHELRAIYRENETIQAQIHRMVAYVFEYFERDWELASLTFSQRHRTLPRLSVSRDNPYLVFRMTVVSAMNRGEIPEKDPDIATAMLMGAIVQIIDTKILGRIKKRLSQCAPQVADECLAVLSFVGDGGTGVGRRRAPPESPET